MALDAVFDALCARLAGLREALTGLRTTAVEDRPLRGDVVLVDAFGDAAEDLLGWLEGALEAAIEARAALARPTDLDSAGRALAACQERCNRIAARFESDLLTYERIADLLRLGRSRGGEWHAWATSVKGALDACRSPLFETNESLFACWREIVERAVAPTVTVQTIAAGRLTGASSKAE